MFDANNNNSAKCFLDTVFDIALARQTHPNPSGMRSVSARESVQKRQRINLKQAIASRQTQEKHTTECFCCRKYNAQLDNLDRTVVERGDAIESGNKVRQIQRNSEWEAREREIETVCVWERNLCAIFVHRTSFAVIRNCSGRILMFIASTNCRLCLDGWHRRLHHQSTWRWQLGVGGDCCCCCSWCTSATYNFWILAKC